MMLDQRTAIISSHGTAFDSAAKVQHETIVEAAKVTVSRGYRYFQIVGAQDTTRTATLYVPGQTQTNGSVSGTAMTTGPYTTYNGTYNSQTTKTPGQVVPLIKPGMDITVRMYRDGEINIQQPGVWDAQSILAVNQ
jgi:hypothetical protein